MIPAYLGKPNTSKRASDLVSESSSVGQERADNEGDDNKLAAKETALVNRSKIAVCLVVLMAAAATGTFTYIFMENEEKVWYLDEFEEFSHEVFETSASQIEQINMAMQLLADEYTSDATHTMKGMNPPNSTLSNFAIKAGKIQRLSRAEMVGFAPMVVSSERSSWEEYARANQGWIKEDLEIEGIEVDPGLIPASIKSAEGSEDQTELIVPTTRFPIWQVSPPPMDATDCPIMLDMYTVIWMKNILDEVIASRQTVFSPVHDIDFLLHYPSVTLEPEGHKEDSEDEVDGDSLQHEDSKDGSEDQDGDDHAHGREVLSLVVNPVFADFGDDAAIVGIVFAVVDWKKFFTGMLEDEASGMVIDLDNTCDSSRFSFLVSDDDAVLLGSSYVPASQYAGASERQALGQSSQEESDDSGDDRRRFLFDADGEPGTSRCGFYVATHITDRFVENWARNTTVLYTVVVVAIFLFTGLVFLIYDLLVQWRQRTVMKTAEKTTAIVSSLFPKEVRERMMAEQEGGAKDRIRTFASKEQNAALDSAPIADLFDACTIMFADLVGFTKWSATREPSQVFRLLETIYGSFDEIAESNGVFKVETIGDCYVAVCGLPEPNKHHAIVMARFAQECQCALDQCKEILVEDLGPDTANLQIRIGLHSGPVSAGVLRGRRARFQLFGDSVNTTARMESTGAPHKIHVSESTADLLRRSGKGHWLKAREEKVYAKGLGDLQTFWLEMKDETATSICSSQIEAHNHSGEWGTDYVKKVKDDNDKKNKGADEISKIRDRLHARLAERRSMIMVNRMQTHNESSETGSS